MTAATRPALVAILALAAGVGAANAQGQGGAQGFALEGPGRGHEGDLRVRCADPGGQREYRNQRRARRCCHAA